MKTAASAYQKRSGLIWATAILLSSLISCSHAPSDESANKKDVDPYLWLEDIESEKSLTWVHAHNKISEEHLLTQPESKGIEEDIRKIALAPDRIPNVTLRNGMVYNFWQDQNSVRGLWRRADLSEYKKAKPNWELLLDLDQLAKDENENWVFKGAHCLEPKAERCLIELSRGGKDAVVGREFDIASKSFVTDGFNLPEAKMQFAWRDKDSAWISTDFGPGSMTQSGYPRQVRLWHRGEDLLSSVLVFESKSTDMEATAFRIIRPEGKHDYLVRKIGFYTSEIFSWKKDSGLKKIAIPADAEFLGQMGSEIFVQLRSSWRLSKATLPEGSIVSVDPEFAETSAKLVYTPGKHSAVSSLDFLKSELILSIMDDVQEKVLRLSKGKNAVWKTETLAGKETGISASVFASDAFSDDILIYQNGFLVPPRVSMLRADAKKPSMSQLRTLPPRFDAKGMDVKQYWVKSSDGQEIPYFVVRGNANSKEPEATMLYGYGGFEISQTPHYLSATGKVWLERRHANYVVANIRGGGEFGPAWHQAAILENRQKAYDDFSAVAKDLIAKKITDPGHLGIWGGSNGGLLMGVAYTQHPELFSAVVCQVPLLDMLRYNKLLAGASWMAEYGNPDDARMAAAIVKYSPYQNVHKEKSYPPILFLTSTKDDRVHPGHARKMMARLEEIGAPAWLWENTEGGHGGAANIEEGIHVQTLAWTFLSSHLGAKLAAIPEIEKN